MVRVLSLVVGLGVHMSSHLLERLAGEKVETSKDVPRAAGSLGLVKGDTFTFERPMQGDLRLDECYEWAAGCGEKAATAWCKNKGFARAIHYPAELVGNKGIRTRLVGNQVVCDMSYCTSFIRIVCDR